jgi:hypothetical protein
VQEDITAFEHGDIDVVAIGQGRGSEATTFGERWGIRFPVLGDPSGKAYRAYGFARGNLWNVVLRGMVTRPIESMHAIARADLRGAMLRSSDVMRLGGVALVDRGGAIRCLHRAEEPADIPSNAEVLAAFGGL